MTSEILMWVTYVCIFAPVGLIIILWLVLAIRQVSDVMLSEKEKDILNPINYVRKVVRFYRIFKASRIRYAPLFINDKDFKVREAALKALEGK